MKGQKFISRFCLPLQKKKKKKNVFTLNNSYFKNTQNLIGMFGNSTRFLFPTSSCQRVKTGHAKMYSKALKQII